MNRGDGAGERVRVETPAASDAATRARWDALVAATPGTDVNQLTAWARVRATVGFTAQLIVARCDGELVGGAQVLLRTIRPLGRLAYLPSGPVVAAGAPDREAVVTALADALAELAGPLRPVFVQPPDGGEDASRALLSRGFRPSQAGISPAGTLRLDLSADEGALRPGTGRPGGSADGPDGAGPDGGVAVRRGDLTDLPLLTRLMTHAARHQGYEPLPAAYVEAFYRELAPEHAVMFVGEVDGRPVAADLLTGCGGVLKSRLGGLDRSGDTGRLGVPVAMRREALRWAREQGYRWFDVGGVDPVVLADLLAGRTGQEHWSDADRAKLAFGGVPHAYPPAVERIEALPVRVVYDALRRSPRGQRALRALTERLRGAGRDPDGQDSPQPA
jgi:hypothetical protein